jgi:general secretion pathway protein C
MMAIKRVFLVVNIFLSVILIAVALITKHSFRQVDIRVLPEVIEVGKLSIPEPVVKPLIYYSEVINQRALFGSPPQDISEGVPGTKEALPRADLRLRLVGTIHGTPTLSRAIIKDLSSGRQSLYRLGDLVDGIKIVGIERNQIVIEQEGRQEILVIDYEGGMLAQGAEPKRVPSSSHPMPTVPVPASPIQLGKEEMAAATETALRIVRKLHLNPDNLPEAPPNLIEAVRVANQVLTRAQIKPHFEGGKLAGFLTTAIQPGSIYERLGLQPGDIIRGVNNQQINSMRDVLRLYKESLQQPIITVNIERGNQPLSLVFEMR